jgi:hypothetical protein
MEMVNLITPRVSLLIKILLCIISYAVLLIVLISRSCNQPVFQYKGGKPGKFPTFENLPHRVPFNLYDPFGLSKNRGEEAKARGLIGEINNGRLAMLGIFGFLCEQTIPGSVPALSGIVKPYVGEVMAPFSADFAL